jgi:hypothetical protein
LSGDIAVAMAFLVTWLAFGANERGHTMIFKAECGNDLARVERTLDLLITRVCGVGIVTAKE